MLQCIVTIDYTWIRSSKPELRHQKKMAHAKIPKMLKCQQSQNCPKMSMIFRYDFHGMLTTCRMTSDQTINKEYYENI